MIGFALLLSATTVAAPAAAPVGDGEDIVVLARKLQSVKLSMALSKRQGIYRAKSCAISRTSGDSQIDPIPCEAAQQCSTLRLTTQDDFVACVKTHGQQQIAALAEARSRERDAQ